MVSVAKIESAVEQDGGFNSAVCESISFSRPYF